MDGADEYTVDELLEEIEKYKSYFGDSGGVTVSGGEPLLQIDFIIKLFQQLKKRHIHTACDTSGVTFHPKNSKNVELHEKLLEVTDLFLLDIKHIDPIEHKKLTGFDNENILAFAKFLSDHNKPMWIRHVIIPSITLNETYLKQLRMFIDSLKTVEKIEALPYHTMGATKYKNLGIVYPLEGILPPTKDEMEFVKKILRIEEQGEEK